MLAKAATSCLTPEDVKLLHFEPYEENHELDIQPRFAGFKIPYFKLDGKVDPDFYRFRFLQTKPSKGFAALTEEPKKPRRYSQPLGTNCGVYLPPLFSPSTWKDIATDKKTPLPLVITEGELKAACACKYGIHTIGLGGVYNWRSAKEGQALLPILEKFHWKAREVIICFDSDASTNAMVRMAASRLAYTLSIEGALVRWANLPEAEDGGKQGLDDYIYKHGPEAFSQILMEAEEIGIGHNLHGLNSEVALVRSTSEIIELATGNVYSPAVFSDSRYRNRYYHETENGKLTKKFTAKEWLAWPLRTEVTEFVYEPACNDLITQVGAYNTWYAQRWPLIPSKTHVEPLTGVKRTVPMAPWEKLFQQVFGSLTSEQQKWARQWLAYPIQKPGTKMVTAMLIWGRKQGTGKTMLGGLMRRVYGKNYGTITNDQLAGQFTEWARDKQFIVGDEIAIGDKRGMADKLKDMVTRETVNINIKNRKTYDVKDCINYYFTSNRADAMFLENADRRFFVVHADKEPLAPEDYEAIQKWIDEEGGGARLYHYLKYEVDLDGFSPTAHAPITDAKLEMTVAGRSEIEDWCFDLAHNVEGVLRANHTQDLWRTEDLLLVYDPEKKGRVGHKALSAALANANVYKIANGNNDAVVWGNRSRLWALRNVPKYQKMGAAAAGRAYEAERPGGPPKQVGQNTKFEQRLVATGPNAKKSAGAGKPN